MKEINGTVSLAYVEEDNKQRVIFRVIPLCTREGGVFHGGAEDFPDEGSLRIVPDKREQSTFKDRMRELGGLCAISLAGDGKELIKVRQNRNYAPEQGERNRLAIYSDVICEFSEDGCFEVLEMGADASAALTAKVLLHKDKVLYGPVTREEASGADAETLRPFGNDRFLLHHIENPLFGARQIYWDPEAVLNWRQRRNALRRRERAPEDGSQEQRAPENAEPPEATPSEEAQEAATDQNSAPREAPAQGKPAASERPQPVAKPVQERGAKTASAAPKPQTPPPSKEAPAGQLPIGSRLDILDTELSFDQQIDRLAQPISSGANLLTMEAEQAEDEPSEVVSHFTGTSLTPSAKPITRSATKPESLHHVVERQLLRRNQDTPDESAYRLVENPIDNLRMCMDYIWQNADMRAQAISVVGENETFMRDMLQVFRRRGLNTQAIAAAQEQFAEIEAERLSLLMQLDAAKANEKKYREEAVASLTQKLRAESERLKRENKELETTQKTLTEAMQVLSENVANRVIGFMSANIKCMSGVSENRIMLSPVMGQHYTARELSEKLRVHMNECGYGMNDDEATALLLYFSVNDALCLSAATEADAARFAQVMLESFGLQSVSCNVQPGSYVEMVSFLPEDGQRTPTVTVQMIGTESMSVYGHKTIYLARDGADIQSFFQPYPVVSVPRIVKRAFVRKEDWDAVKPASVGSFADIRADAYPMLDEAEKWFGDLKSALESTEITFPDAMLADMRRFMEVATRRIRGGFIGAADSAVCHWVVPILRVSQPVGERLNAMMAGLPKALEMLGTPSGL